MVMGAWAFVILTLGTKPAIRRGRPLRLPFLRYGAELSAGRHEGLVLQNFFRDLFMSSLR